jgi:transposase
MANKYKLLEGDILEFESALKDSKDVGEYRRLQAVFLRLKHQMCVADISKATGFSETYIRHLHSNYKLLGFASVKGGGKGGRYNAHLSLHEEKELLQPFLDKAKSGGILEVSAIHSALEKKVGHKLNRQVTYNILARNNWRKITPRPRHPKADSVVQDTFKKTGQQSLKKRSLKQ